MSEEQPRNAQAGQRQKQLEKDLKQPNEFYEQNIQTLRRDLQKDPEQKVAP